MDAYLREDPPLDFCRPDPIHPSSDGFFSSVWNKFPCSTQYPCNNAVRSGSRMTGTKKSSLPFVPLSV